MAEPTITLEVQRFLAEHIQSAEELDILLLLHGAPDRDWTARQVSEAVFTVPTSATMRLEQLVAKGLLVSTGGTDPGYKYGPTSPDLAGRVDALAAAHRTDRVAVMQLVFKKPADPLKSFSDAFRLRRED